MISWKRTLRRFSTIAIATAVLAVLAPSAAIPAKTDVVVSWAAPTPPEGAVLGLAAQTQLSVQLEASSPSPGVTIHITAASGAPPGAALKATDGNPAKATFTWTPKGTQVGEYHVTFSATSTLPVGNAQRTIVIRVGPPNRPPPGPPPPPGVYPKRLVYSDQAKETYRWAFVKRPTVARSGPSRSARALSKITYRTPELYRNAIQVLKGIKFHKGKTWVQVRLAILPNGSTGWVPRGTLTGFQAVHTRMVISHSKLRATLYKRGKPIFSTRVGVGQPHYPTPRGDFYIREKLQGYYSPAYGPRAFGLNARSAVLTDWPGGGFVGIHGTNQPQLIPGRISHGCVRVNNAAVMRLFRLMPIGTPVHIS